MCCLLSTRTPPVVGRPLSGSDSPSGAALPPRGHWAVSGDVRDCDYAVEGHTGEAWRCFGIQWRDLRLLPIFPCPGHWSCVLVLGGPTLVLGKPQAQHRAWVSAPLSVTLGSKRVTLRQCRLEHRRQGCAAWLPVPALPLIISDPG